MASVTSAPPLTVSFPVSDPSPKHAQPVPHLRPPHLPFRRISLPSAPSLLHRESVISVASFDSLPEEGESPSSSVPSVAQNVHPGKVGGKGRPTSIESPRRRRRPDVTSKIVDDARATKRWMIIEEFYETEKAYVDGLELIYTHFLTPIISSLNTPNPLLDRAGLTSVFSNFIDIWNLHRSFFSSLSSLLSKAGIPLLKPAKSATQPEYPPPLSPILLSHFPYLSLYTPFVTSFPATISVLTGLISAPTATHPNPQYSPTFASFLSTQEADPRCGKLKLRDWMLTIVQRCPRYLLLLKDLISYTDPDDPEHAQLTTVHTLVSKITLSLNTSLHTHAQTLALLSLQRSTPNLPFQLIVPGRTLLKRGSLLQIERSSQPREREFLLFSDCLIWLAGEEIERAWKGDWGISRGGWGAGYTYGDPPAASASSSPLGRPQMLRSRSKSEAELSGMKDFEQELETESPSPSTPTTPSKHAPRNAFRRSYHPPANMINRHASNSGGDERWVYKGRAELVDFEIIVTPARELGEERRFEVLSPEGSFVLYAGTENERDDWCSAIRQAKAQLLVSLNVTHPNSTLTSSSSTNHIRRTLQALPFPPSDERIATIRENRHDSRQSKGKGKRNTNLMQERRRKVEHWVPAIWIPDEKTGGCMRCGKTFSWRRRRHHCRLCGRCVCASCSGRTFFVSDPNARDDSSKSARACDACYETVFPLLDPPESASHGIYHKNYADTISSLGNLPSWLSMPSFPIRSTPEALMAIDREPSRDSPEVIPEEELIPDLKTGAVRRKSSSQHGRPRSVLQLLEGFETNEQGRSDVLDLPLQEGDGEDEYYPSSREPSLMSAAPPSSTSSPRKEDTARRNKRFSLPAIALHTTSVTARTEFGDTIADSEGIGSGGPKLNKRFSLVLGGARSHGISAFKSHNEFATKADSDDARGGLGRGIAARKLSELLTRRKE